MANKAKKKNNNKNLIIGICVAVVLIVAIVLAVVFAVRGGGINDDYFVSDDTKYVLTVESEDLSFDEEEEAYAPIRTHMVYTYSGDEITGLKSYYEYADANAAKTAFEQIKASGEEVGNAELNGKYIIMTATEDDYEGMTASDVKQQIEFMDMLKNMNLEDEGSDEGEATEEATTEAAE